VVLTLDFGTMDDGTPFLAMELLHGETLAAQLARSGPLSPREAGAITRQIANALDEAHAIGILHRDIKPANVFLMRTGRDVFVKLIDFGIAKALEGSDRPNLTMAGAVLGTPSYMSPEQLTSPAIATKHADLWALAVTAYEMLFGEPPFRGASTAALAIAIHDRDFARPSALRPAAGLAPLDAFFARAFARDPGARFAAALELADAFEAAVHVGDAGRPPVSSRVATVPGGPIDFQVPSARQTTTAAPVLSLRTDDAAPIPRTESRAVRSAARKIGGIGLGVALSITVLGGAVYVASRNGSGSVSSPPKRSAVGVASAFTTTAVSPSVAPDGRDAASPRAGSGRTLTVAVPAGMSRSAAAWLGAFTLRAEGATADSLLEAHRRCRASNRLVCSDAQWSAACEHDSSLAAHRAWTALVREGVAVGRGGSGCDASAPASTGTRLAVVCCDAAVATVAIARELGSSDALEKATNPLLAAYQAAVNAADAKRTAALLDDPLLFLGKRWSRASYEREARQYFAKHPQVLAYDRCVVTVNRRFATWEARCDLTMAKDDRILSLQHRLVFGGPDDKIQEIDERHVQAVK
ncbi:MAG TPA: protein kinase, partial [Polyangiaceae bacterium]|nr:protein kinase [Polyangiaceae bacterium]